MNGDRKKEEGRAEGPRLLLAALYHETAGDDGIDFIIVGSHRRKYSHIWDDGRCQCDICTRLANAHYGARG
jgi:hypothetical protein